MNIPEYLYHYTSLETLALILENRTICFNSLLNVDDVEEAETADIKNFGKYVCVSCWTDEEKEMIPMWNLYTKDMHGVRIRMPTFPFEKYKYKKGQYNFTEDTESYIDYEKIYTDSKSLVTSNFPLLVPVTYTDDTDKLFPNARIKGTAEDAQRFIRGDFEHIDIVYSLKELGKNKRTEWSFQKEWRYILWFSPLNVNDYFMNGLKQQQEFVRRMENPYLAPPYQRFFLKLRQDVIQQMDVLFGPCMSEAEKIIAKSLLKAYGLEGRWKESSLKIRERGK